MNAYSSPKERFQANKEAAKAHADLIAQPQFRGSIDVALLQFQHESVKNATDDPSATGLRLQGAQQFVYTLLGLADLPLRTSRRDLDNLQPTD